VIEEKLPMLQQAYRPLNSVTQLRVPAPGRGGHDIFYNGKVTNRSDSFADHRATVQFLLRLYGGVTRRAEEELWLSTESLGGPDGGYRLEGSPVFVQFSEGLSQETFTRWVGATFRRKNNRFRLGGNPFVLSDSKIHVYGVDRHLWQPVTLEATRSHIYLFLPNGSCGNIVHRLVTNIQRYLDPDVSAWIGEDSFEQLVESSPLQAA
jgi:hypothetical protein